MTASRICSTGLLLVVLIATGQAQGPATSSLPMRLDHLVYATPDLNLGIETIDKLLGVRATAGGQHPGLGTRNALVARAANRWMGRQRH